MNHPSATWVMATGNPGKLAEVQSLLHPYQIELLSQSQFPCVPAEEVGLTFVENALLKARSVCDATGLPALADDSGLVVPALDGEPGLYSSRYGGEDATDQQNVQCLVQKLVAHQLDHTPACFMTVMVWLRHAQDPAPVIAQGQWWGQVITQPRGTEGFGYDPMFYLPERDQVAAELSKTEKNHLSHRGQAMRQLLALCAESGVIAQCSS